MLRKLQVGKCLNFCNLLSLHLQCKLFHITAQQYELLVKMEFSKAGVVW